MEYTVVSGRRRPQPLLPETMSPDAQQLPEEACAVPSARNPNPLSHVQMKPPRLRKVVLLEKLNRWEVLCQQVKCPIEIERMKCQFPGMFETFLTHTRAVKLLLHLLREQYGLKVATFKAQSAQPIDLHDTDAIIAAGGDGTFLEAASLVNYTPLPCEVVSSTLCMGHGSCYLSGAGANNGAAPHDASRPRTVPARTDGVPSLTLENGISQLCCCGSLPAINPIWVFGVNTDPSRSEGRLLFRHEGRSHAANRGDTLCGTPAPQPATSPRCRSAALGIQPGPVHGVAWDTGDYNSMASRSSVEAGAVTSLPMLASDRDMDLRKNQPQENVAQADAECRNPLVPNDPAASPGVGARSLDGSHLHYCCEPDSNATVPAIPCVEKRADKFSKTTLQILPPNSRDVLPYSTTPETQPAGKSGSGPGRTTENERFIGEAVHRIVAGNYCPIQRRRIRITITDTPTQQTTSAHTESSPLRNTDWRRRRHRISQHGSEVPQPPGTLLRSNSINRRLEFPPLHSIPTVAAESSHFGNHEAHVGSRAGTSTVAPNSTPQRRFAVGESKLHMTSSPTAAESLCMERIVHQRTEPNQQSIFSSPQGNNGHAVVQRSQTTPLRAAVKKTCSTASIQAAGSNLRTSNLWADLENRGNRVAFGATRDNCDCAGGDITASCAALSGAQTNPPQQGQSSAMVVGTEPTTMSSISCQSQNPLNPSSRTAAPTDQGKNSNRYPIPFRFRNKWNKRVRRSGAGDRRREADRSTTAPFPRWCPAHQPSNPEAPSTSLFHRVTALQHTHRQGDCLRHAHDNLVNQASNKQVHQRRRTAGYATRNSNVGTVEYRAVNDVILTPAQSHMTLYVELSVDGGPPMRSKNSGVLVCTGSGSTAWAFNIIKITEESVDMVMKEFANAQPETVRKQLQPVNAKDLCRYVNSRFLFEPTEAKMHVVIREPIDNRVFSTPIPSAFGQIVTLRPLTMGACLSLDGLAVIPVNFGQTVTLEIAHGEDILLTAT